MSNEYKLRIKPITTPKKLPSEQQVRDTFQTPRYAVNLLKPYIPSYIDSVWECASGNGRIARPLTEFGYDVFSSDIAKSESWESNLSNFLTDETPETVLHWLGQARNFSIITNPPFSIKELFIERCFQYGVPFALLINADYSQWQIDLINRGCEKIIPKRRISYITPNVVRRVNEGEGTSFESLEEISGRLLKKYSSSQFHSMWLTYKFNLGRTETFVDLPISEMENF